MGWKSVAWIAWLLPALTGCGAIHNLTTEKRINHTQRAIERDLRADARTAWQCVRNQHPQRTFTAEFHDGFLDGFVDYLDRGGDAQPPAVPPIKYVRDKKYFTPEGHCLINDYYLGFKYGTDVAVASGKRQYLTVPVLLPDACGPTVEGHIGPGTPGVPGHPGATPPMPYPLPPPRPGTGKFGEPKKSDDPPQPPSNGGGGAPKPIPPLPKPELPVIKPFDPPLPNGGKFMLLPEPPNPDRLPVPDPPLPIPDPPIDPLPVPPEEPKLSIPPVLNINSPAAPAGPPVPPVLGDIPAIPFTFGVPVPTPVANLLPRK